MRIGIELEYPKANDPDNKLRKPAAHSNGLQRSIRDSGGLGIPGSPDGDPTVGLEYTSPVIDDLEESVDWYGDVIEAIETEHDAIHAATSLIRDGEGSSTAGLHLHLSPLNERQATKLFEWSQEPWLQVFACTAVTDEHSPVFRENYCSFNYDRGHHSVVNQRGASHYEWRLPEPMLPEHYNHLAEFLHRFVDQDNPESAKRYALNCLNDGEVITSLERAQYVEFQKYPFDHYNVERSAHPETESWFWNVMERNDKPYIHKVELDGEVYYGFQTELSRDFEYDGVEWSKNSVLDAVTLEVVEDAEVVNTVNELVRRHRDGELSDDATEAKQELLTFVEESQIDIEDWMTRDYASATVEPQFGRNYRSSINQRMERLREIRQAAGIVQESEITSSTSNPASFATGFRSE